LTLVNVSGVERGLLVAKVNGTESDNQTTTIENVTVNGSSNFKLVGEVSNDALVRIDGAYYVDDNESLNKVLTVSDVNEWDVLLGSGEYTMPKNDVLKNKTLNLSGTKDVIINMVSTDQSTSGASLAFEGVTIKWGIKNYTGLQHTAAVTYRNCDIEGLQFLYATSVKFENCKLDSKDAEHSVWTYGSNEVEFTGCDFVYSDRAVNCFADSGKPTTEATFTNCTFTKVAGKETTGAIETNSSLMTSLTLNINNCTVNEGDLWWVSGWDEKKGANTVTFVDGNRVASTQEQLAAAIKNGATEVTLGKGTYRIPSEVAGKTIILNGCGDDTVFDFNNKAYNVGNASITFKNLKIEGVNANQMSGFGIQHTDGKIEYVKCTLNNAITSEFKGDVEYTECNFTGTYYITTYSVKSATFTGCTFDKEDSRAVLVYSHGDNPVKVSLTGCRFEAKSTGKTAAGDWTAAVEIDTTNIPTEGTEVTIRECTADSNYSGIVRDKSAAGKANAVISVDGTAYTQK